MKFFLPIFILFILVGCSINRPNKELLDIYQPQSSFNISDSNSVGTIIIQKPLAYGPPRGDFRIINIENNSGIALKVKVYPADYVALPLCKGINAFTSQFYAWGNRVGKIEQLGKHMISGHGIQYFLLTSEFVEISEKEALWWLDKINGWWLERKGSIEPDNVYTGFQNYLLQCEKT
ncbi:hypothetical protein [Pseudoalteromonas sp. HF66]|uniref:hypothetical protein n=1 Tax=Pseudoalteromonas sp. HF66 TaxID=2721559 RepID=UPI0014303D36|nr:hypothetical protein [Pseudoalteromonas sp. HF66]NIZ07790.1 hypothetical protein [Pseudoalteromonas sp. HF66]